MGPDARQAYLETQVLTATPQKLRLMLIEGAIRHARQAIAHWEADRHEQSSESQIRCREIISELLSGIQPVETEVAKSTAKIYLFLFQTLIQSQTGQNPEKLREAIEVLEVERETWQLLCEQMPAAPPRSATGRGKEIKAIGAAILPTHSSAVRPKRASGLSLDA